MVQWLRCHTSTAGGMGSIPGPGMKIPHATRRGQRKENKKEREREKMYVYKKLLNCLPVPFSVPTSTECVSSCWYPGQHLILSLFLKNNFIIVGR